MKLFKFILITLINILLLIYIIYFSYENNNILFIIEYCIVLILFIFLFIIIIIVENYNKVKYYKFKKIISLIFGALSILTSIQTIYYAIFIPKDGEEKWATIFALFLLIPTILLLSNFILYYNKKNKN